MSAYGPKWTLGALNEPRLNRYDAAPEPRGQLMRRREFIGLLGGAAAWPLAAHAEQKAGQTIGLLGCTSADESTRVLDALRAGLK